MDEKFPLSVAVLMGGESRRFGSPKAFVPFGKGSLAAHVLGEVAHYAGEVFTVARHPDQAPPDARGAFPIVMDSWEQRGPLAGLHAALGYAKYPAVFLRGVDMPFLNRETVAGFLERFEASGRPDVVIPRRKGKWEPLCALWNRGLFSRLEHGRWASFQKLLEGEELRIQEVKLDELREWDPFLRCLQNINQPEDLKKISFR